MSTDSIAAYAQEIKGQAPKVDTAARSLAQQIFDVDDVETILYPVPRWGITLELRSPNGEERAGLQSMFVDLDATQATGEVKMRDLKTMYPSIIITCAYDPATGERVFDMNPQTVAMLNMKNGELIEKIAMACMPLVGLTAGDVEEKKGGSSTSLPSGNAFT